MPDCDTIIVGAGLAGACAALWQSGHERVRVLEAERPAAGASGAAAGLVNPLMGRRARLAWRADEALDALHATLDAAGAADLFSGGILRPARDATQARHFQEAAAAYPEHGGWLLSGEVAERAPGVVCPDGALWVRQGGAIRVAAFIEALLSAARRQGAEVRSGVRVTDWGETADEAFLVCNTGERLTAARVLLALGYGLFRHAEWQALGLHGVKGQTVRIAAPAGLAVTTPLSGYGYVVPEDDTLVVGSTYEHTFTDLRASDAQTRRLLARADRMVPGLAGARVLDATAGVRVNVPGTRLPLVGPLPGLNRVWVFCGLGSKGLMTAPLLARDLPGFFADPAKIPTVVRLP